MGLKAGIPLFGKPYGGPVRQVLGLVWWEIMKCKFLPYWWKIIMAGNACGQGIYYPVKTS
jgi:hypothetical protein